MTDAEPTPVPPPGGSIKGHPWEDAVITGHVFAGELGKIGVQGRAWVLKEVGVAENGRAAFVLGLGCGTAGALVGVAIARLCGL